MKRTGRGFSLIELLIAGALSVVFTGAVSAALINSMSMAQDSLTKGALEQKVRVVSDTMLFFLRGAGPPGVCLQPGEGFPLESCRSVGESSQAFAAASSTSMTFYSYSTQLDGAATADVFEVPDKVVFRYDAGNLLIERYAPASGATYTSPNWVSDVTLVRVLAVTLPSDVPLFAYFDAAGNSLTNASGIVPDAKLPDIALVEIHPRTTADVRGQTKTAGTDSAVAVSSGLGGAS